MRPPRRRRRRSAGQGQEHVVQRRQAQPQLGDGRPAASRRSATPASSPGSGTATVSSPAASVAGGLAPDELGQRAAVTAAGRLGCSGRTCSRWPPTSALSSSGVPAAMTRPWSSTTMSSASCVGLLQVLGGQQHGGAVGGQRRGSSSHSLVAAARVQAGGRLVEEQHVRPADQAGGEVEPPAHAAGVGAHRPAARRRRGRTASISSAARCRASRRGRPSSRATSTRFSVPVSASSTAAYWPVSPMRGADRCGFGGRRRGPARGHVRSRGAAAWRAPHGGGLARAVRPEQAEHGAAADREVHAVERPGRPEALAQVLDLDDGVHDRSVRRRSDRTLTAR